MRTLTERALIITWVALWLVPSRSQAQEKHQLASEALPENVESLSLEELLNSPISTPSQQLESIHSTAAIISVVTAEEISNLGAETLWEVLNTLPGIEVSEGTGSYHLITFRGISPPTNSDRRCLVMINGHPFRDPQNGSYHLEIIPVTAIKQIEIVRGPGSVQYGSDAFAGVINIITKDAKDSAANRFYALYGKFRTANVGASAAISGEGLSAFAAAEYRGGDGYPFTRLDSAGQQTQLRNRENYQNAYLELAWKDFKLSGQYFAVVRDEPNPDTIISTSRQGVSSDLRFEHSFSNQLSASAMLYFNSWSRQDQGPNPLLINAPRVASVYPVYGFQWGGSARLTWQVLRWARASAGVGRDLNALSHSDDPMPPVPSRRESDFAAFGELSASPIERLGVSFGIRYDLNSTSGGFVVPRAGVVYDATPDLAIKLLYARAFRSPTLAERYRTNSGGDVQQVDPGPSHAPLGPPSALQPELIDSVDLGADWKLHKHTLRINGFYVLTKDLIYQARTGTFINSEGSILTGRRYTNTPGYSSVGVEAEIRGFPTSFLSYFANVSTKYVYQGAFSNKLPWRAPVLANAGLTYTLQKFVNLKLTTYATLVGRRSGFPDNTIVSPAYVLWNANLMFELTRKIEVALILHNILNRKYTFPDYGAVGGLGFPGAPFEAFGRLTLRF